MVLNLLRDDPVIMLTRVVFGLALPLLIGQSAPWRQFAPKEGGFTVSLPAAPKEKKDKLKLPAGAADVTLFLCEAPGEVTYVVSVTDYPPADVQGGEEQRLRHARDGAVKNSQGKQFHERKIALDGHPGREVWITTPGDGMIHLRLYAVGPRLYQTMAVGPKSQIETKDTAKFMDSFKLKK